MRAVIRGDGTSGPVPLSEGGSSMTLDEAKDASPLRGKSLPVLIAAHNTTCTWKNVLMTYH